MSQFHEWLAPDGSPWAVFYRQEGAYLIRFIGLADFIVSGIADNIDMYPVHGVPDDTLDYLYRNLVEPLAISHRGDLVLHAGAVEVDGVAVLFSGPSGSGKSTLVASFAAGEFRILSDDGVQLGKSDSEYWVHPQHNALRLWEDSGDALLSQFKGASRVVNSCEKSTFVIKDKSAFCDEICPLRHIYFLEDVDAEEISICPLSGAEAIIKLATHSFMLDVSDKTSLTRKFESISKMVALPIFFSLAYPRRYESLPEVREAVVKHLRAGQWEC
jgi:hypothetical protein